MKSKEYMKLDKVQKLTNYKRPETCISCGKHIIPKIHLVIIREGLFRDIPLAKFYTDHCEWCGNEFSYWE